MNVPYSMDDSEPDLYGGMGGYNDDEYTQTKWEGNGYSSTSSYLTSDPKIYTQADMTKVIQKNLEAVHAYRLEVQELLDILSFIYTHSEKLPLGSSQIIREQLTKTRQ